MNNVVQVYRGDCGGATAPDENGLITEKSLKIFIPETDGGQIEFAGGKKFFGLREIVIVPPNSAHKISTAEGITVLIEQPLLPLKEITVVSDVINEGIRSAAEQAAAFFAAETRGKEAVLNALGELLTAYILTLCANEGISPAVAALKADVDKYFTDSAYSVDVAIRKLPLNYDYVRKLFKKETGVTPHEYLTRARMSRAKEIILSGVTNRYSEYTVTQIAEACGFAEPLYFSRVFKKYFGVSPSRYVDKK